MTTHGNKVRFDDKHTVRNIENVRAGETRPYVTEPRREPIREAGAEVTTAAILRQARDFVSAFNEKFSAGSQSSNKGYIGQDASKRTASRKMEDEAFGEIARNRSRANRSFENHIGYRVACTLGTPAGNSEELSLAMKDLANANGLAARIVQIQASTKDFQLSHRVTLVAATEEKLDALNGLPAPDSPAAEGLVVIDKYLKVSCAYSNYPNYAIAQAYKWEDRDIGIRDERTGELVGPVASGWAKALKSFPKGAEVLEFENLPRHTLEQISVQELERRGMSRAPDRQER